MRRAACLLVLLLLAGLCDAQRPKRAKSSATNEPFDTFNIIDTKLAQLAPQQAAVKQAISPSGSKATETRPGSPLRRWTKPAQNLERTARSIKVLAGRQERRYRRLKQPFGVTAFRQLAKRATAVELTARRIKRAREERTSIKQEADLEKRILALVLQFQAISGGYAAARCSVQQQPCCLPKDEPKSANNDVGCKWQCVAARGACRSGFLGPRPPG
jgi:hypothetical protein